MFFDRNSWTYVRNEKRDGKIEPLIVASAQVLKEPGRVCACRDRRGPQ